MRSKSEMPRSRRRSIAVAALFAAATITGCGGGGGDGGGSSLTSEQQVALAAGSAAGVTQLAIDQTEDTGGGMTLSRTTRNTSGAITRAVETTDCADLAGTGEIKSYDNDGNNDTTLDNLPGEDFPTLFTGTLPALVPEYSQLRANCVADGFRLEGALDVSTAQINAGEVVVLRAGSFQGLAASNLPNTAELLVSESESSGTTTRNSLGGVLHLCDGCVEADLGDFSGTPGFDLAAALWVELDLELADLPRTRLSIGNSEVDPFTLVSHRVVASTAEVDLEGRLAVDSEDNMCDFDVTYDTLESIVIEDFDRDTSMTTAGALNVAINNSGETFLVEYDSDGNVNVNGERVDIDEFEEACNL